MTFLFLAAGLPLAYLAAVGVLLSRGRRRGLGASVLAFLVTLGVGAWSILQSRSSTAGIGFLVLPAVAAAVGVLAWTFRNLQHHPALAARIAGWACLVAALAVVGWELRAGRETIALNRARDADQRARTTRIEAHRAAVAAALAARPGDEAAVLSALVREHEQDPEFLLAALESRFASPDDLDRLARKDDFGVTLTALRNPACRADTLVRILRTHAYPDYFLQAVAAHPNTPPEVLREIHAQSPRRIGGLDHWLSRNPSSPPDVLEALSTSTEPDVIQGLLQNPALPCTLLPAVARALAASPRPGDAYSTSRLAELRARPCP